MNGYPIPSLNTVTHDLENHHTSHGRHNRLIVFATVGGVTKITIREDIAGLPNATLADLRRAAAGPQRLHPRGTRLAWEATTEHQASRWHEFRVTGGGR